MKFTVTFAVSVDRDSAGSKSNDGKKPKKETKPKRNQVRNQNRNRNNRRNNNRNPEDQQVNLLIRMVQRMEARDRRQAQIRRRHEGYEEVPSNEPVVDRPHGEGF